MTKIGIFAPSFSVPEANIYVGYKIVLKIQS